MLIRNYVLTGLVRIVCCARVSLFCSTGAALPVLQALRAVDSVDATLHLLRQVQLMIVSSSLMLASMLQRGVCWRRHELPRRSDLHAAERDSRNSAPERQASPQGEPVIMCDELHSDCALLGDYVERAAEIGRTYRALCLLSFVVARTVVSLLLELFCLRLLLLSRVVSGARLNCELARCLRRFCPPISRLLQVDHLTHLVRNGA